MKKLNFVSPFLRPFLSIPTAITVGVILVTSTPVNAARLVTVLFTGFSASSGEQTGLDILNNKLQNSFASINLPFSSKVFQHFEQQPAFDFINGFDDVCCLTLIGHSLGGDSVIELANDFLLPQNKKVNLTIQIDSVGIGDEKLPENVNMGINYFQISTGTFEPQGAQNVMGAMNFNVEQLFDDKEITHTSIDDDPRLHKRILSDIKAKCVPEPSSVLSVLGFAALGLSSALKRNQK
jgi:hypothetical protein